MIVAHHLGKKFGRVWAVRRVEFSLGIGETLVVVGQNGSGKSTLLRLLAGLERASEGNVVRDARQIGFISPEMHLYPSLTALEHLEMAARLRGLRGTFGALLNRVGLTESADKLAGEFSTGMKTRLKLALALQPEPQILLLDEPGAGLDAAGRALVDVLISEQKTRGCVVLATNDESERRFADYELRLDE